MVAIMTIMNTVQSNSSAKKSRLVLFALAFSLLLSVAAGQVVAVSVSLYFASLQEASIEQSQNFWLDAAETLSYSNPEVFDARAKFLRQKALLPELELQRDELLQQALFALNKASEIRPLWPYYPLAELNLLVLLDADALIIQQKVAHIIQLAPNERGLDKHFLELAFHSWDKLSLTQQEWMLNRLKIVPRGTFNYVFSVAKKLKQKSIVCTNLPYTKIKKLCKTR